jgi:hypothetical protein
MSSRQRPKPYVIYHSPCIDGFGAAYAAWKHFGDTAHYVPLNHGARVPELKQGTDVYMVDISFKRPILLEFAKRHHKVVILDHHVTAREELAGIMDEIPNVDVRFDMDHSGAFLSWDYFNPIFDIPQLLLHVEDRDLWRHALPNTPGIVAALSTHAQDFELWDRLADNLDQLTVEGAVLLRQQASHLESLLDIVRAAVFNTPDGTVIVPAVNAPYFLSSELGHALVCKYPQAPFSVSYRDNGKGQRDWSLRSEDDRMNVGQVAKLYGGGGHRNASGMSEDTAFARIKFLAGSYDDYLAAEALERNNDSTRKAEQSDA